MCKNCSALETVSLNANISIIPRMAFAGCSSLVNVYYLGTIGEWCSILFNNNYANPMNYASCFYVLENDNWCELRNIVIPDTVQSINKYQFYGFSNVTSFTFPNSLISIGFSSFYDCKSLSSLEFPSELTSIGEEAFNNCSSLKSVTMGNKLNKIDKFAFENCTLLNKVYYQGLITEWCNISFGNEYSNPMYMASEFYMLNGEQYNKVTSITIPEGIKTIGNYQFCGFKNVTSFNIASDVTTIGEGAFSECKSLTSIVLPDSVVSLLYRAFYNCSNLNRIIMSNKITSIGAFSFYNCTSLASIIIPSSVTFIGTYTFYGCSILTINCEAKAKPSGWDASWNKSNCPVNWGYVVD